MTIAADSGFGTSELWPPARRVADFAQASGSRLGSQPGEATALRRAVDDGVEGTGRKPMPDSTAPVSHRRNRAARSHLLIILGAGAAVLPGYAARGRGSLDRPAGCTSPAENE